MARPPHHPEAAHLEAVLLGRPELRWQTVTLEPPPRLRALLFYLLVRAEPVTRGELEEVLWSPGAGHSLRQALHELRGLPGAHRWLHAGPEVGVEARADLTAFGAAVGEGRYSRALDLWPRDPPGSRNVLLWGFRLDRAPAFDDWLEIERARVELLYLQALEGRALELERAGALAEALHVVRCLLREDELHESAYRMAMRLCARQGQPEAALAYFDRCRRVFGRELGTAPLEETLVLAREIAAAPPPAPFRPVSVRQALDRLRDPRDPRGRRYPLTPSVGLVLLAFLQGAESLRDIVQFGWLYPQVLPRLGFPRPTPPGRSALCTLLGHVEPRLLGEALRQARPPLGLLAAPGGRAAPTTLDLLRAFALELRQGPTPAGTDDPQGWLERLGWPDRRGAASPRGPDRSPPFRPGEEGTLSTPFRPLTVPDARPARAESGAGSTRN